MEFVTAKDMVLALYLDRFRYALVTPDLTNEEELREDRTGENWTYTFHRSDGKHIWRGERNVYSRLLGKVLIYPGPQWANIHEREEEYPEFIISVDSAGMDVCHSCDPDGLANLFGANQGAPSYLTPIFLPPRGTAEVLQRPKSVPRQGLPSPMRRIVGASAGQ
jgi:hypothetical protein